MVNRPANLPNIICTPYKPKMTVKIDKNHHVTQISSYLQTKTDNIIEDNNLVSESIKIFNYLKKMIIENCSNIKEIDNDWEIIDS